MEKVSNNPWSAWIEVESQYDRLDIYNPPFSLLTCRIHYEQQPESTSAHAEYDLCQYFADSSGPALRALISDAAEPSSSVPREKIYLPTESTQRYPPAQVWENGYPRPSALARITLLTVEGIKRANQNIVGRGDLVE
ncbi:hypothetical protein H102_02455 [Trichophyton rubrum CBS 100081]|nr:hypothetical protein H102_02455 [Trichophyton rubrum CBS 100081]